MPEEMTVYRVSLSGRWEGQAASMQDAIDKTVAYFAEHLDELNYDVSTRTVFLNSEED